MARFNFPSRLPRDTGLPRNTGVSVLKYPSNLIADRRKYYVSLDFSEYEPPSLAPEFFDSATNLIQSIGNLIDSAQDLVGQIPGVGAFRENFSPDTSPTAVQGIFASYPTLTDSIVLPLPRKLNDNLVQSWSERSLTDIVSSFTGVTRAAVNVTRLQSAFSGVTLNPYLYLYFDRPNFKRYSFTWTLAPRNDEESSAISQIIKIFKENSSPAISGALMLYPSIVQLRFFPDDDFQMMKLKPCIIESVMADYTPAGPSYFNGTGAQTLVNLTINFKEIELWAKGDDF